MRCAISFWTAADELAKIRAEVAATGVPGALGLVVRVALPKGGAKLDLSGKFGAEADEAVAFAAGRSCVCGDGWGSASMSGRSASIRWPGGRRWR